MSQPFNIPANFRVPRNCKHEWLLFHENEFIGAICGIPGKKRVHQMFREPTNATDPARVMSLSLDWIQESVEHLRYLCEQ